MKKWLLLAGATLLGALYYLFDPAQSVLAPKCTFHAITGYDCPGCGSQRMLHALLHGNFADAWHANPFLLCTMPYLLLLIFSSSFRTKLPRLYAILNSPLAIILFAILLIAWTIARNLGYRL